MTENQKKKKSFADKINAVKESAPLKETPKASGKKKMGRPKKAKEDLKSKQIPSYFTEKEHQAIIDAAELLGKSVGEFVRIATLEKLN